MEFKEFVDRVMEARGACEGIEDRKVFADELVGEVLKFYFDYLDGEFRAEILPTRDTQILLRHLEESGEFEFLEEALFEEKAEDIECRLVEIFATLWDCFFKEKLFIKKKCVNEDVEVCVFVEQLIQFIEDVVLREEKSFFEFQALLFDGYLLLSKLYEAEKFCKLGL